MALGRPSPENSNQNEKVSPKQEKFQDQIDRLKSIADSFPEEKQKYVYSVVNQKFDEIVGAVDMTAQTGGKDLDGGELMKALAERMDESLCS